MSTEPFTTQPRGNERATVINGEMQGHDEMSAGIGSQGDPNVESQDVLQRIYLIRHGETTWSLTGQPTSRSDPLLTAHGEQEARRLAERLRGVVFSRVLTSPLQRARRTCELCGLGSVAEIEPDLVEWRPIIDNYA